MAKKKLTLEQYCDFVTQMASKDSMKNFKSKLGTAGLGLAGEAGEVADQVKKVLFHGMKYDEDVRQKLIKETGDILWYVAFVCRNVLNVTIEEVLEQNVEKLRERYKEGKFSTKDFLKKEKAKN